jgi:hypothetical protein
MRRRIDAASMTSHLSDTGSKAVGGVLTAAAMKLHKGVFVQAFAKARALVLAAALAGCQSTSMDGTASMAPIGYAAEFPKLTCTSWGKPQGRADKLTAKRVKAGDPAYMEFRLRAALSVPSGHLYVVFGRLDAEGKPATRQYMGLFPDLGPVGLYAGAVVPMPAQLEPDFNDCTFPASAAYRVSLTEEQYQRLLGKVRGYLANPPKWRMFGFNCNNFAATLGEAAGLREPANRNQPSFSYIHAYIKANGDA